MRIGLLTDGGYPYATGDSGGGCDHESPGAVDLRHAASGGAAALPGRLAERLFGVPLLVTEHDVGAAARARALERFTVEQNLAVLRGIYLELISHTPVRREADAVDAHGVPLPFAAPPEARLLGHGTQPGPHFRPPRVPEPEGVCAVAAGPAGTAMRDHPALHDPGDLPGPGGRPDHGDHPMTRPDDPATPADAPERPAEIRPRTTDRYRHRDVFALADGPPGPGPDADARAAWTLLALLPGAACLATAGVLRVTEGVLGDGTRALVTVVGAVLACLALRACLGRGPLRAPEGAGRAGVYGCWLLSYAVYGEELLAQVMTGGPDGPWGGTPAPLLGLATAVAPAAWCAHLFTVHAHRELAGSLEEFGAGVRLLFLAAVTLFLGALVPLLYLADLGLKGGGASVAAAALGVLFFVARLLAAHGLPEPGTVALAAACAVEAGGLALVLAARLPGLEPLAQPVNALVSAGGTGAVPALACGGAAVGLLLHAAFALSEASAHTRT